MPGKSFISAGKVGIAGHPAIGFVNAFSGSLAWTPQSLVVQDATPTHVDITFPSAKTVLASDFTIVGITATVLSLSWIGNVCTLVLSTDVLLGNTLTVVYKGKSYSVTNNVVNYYVDVFNGNDSNAGTINHPFATLAHADSVLTLNAPLKLKYPNEKWVNAPAYWHGLKALFPMMNDGITPLNCYDVANGITGVLEAGADNLAFQYAGVSFNGISSNSDIKFGVGVLGIGTGDETVLVSIRPTYNDDNIHAIFSNGAFAGQAGQGIYQNLKGFGFQMRSAGTIAYQYTDAQMIPNNFVFAATVKRNDANGLKLYLNGVYKNSPGDSTVSLGVQDLTNTIRNTFIGKDAAGTYLLKADWIKELRIYNTVLSGADITAATNEMVNNTSKVFPFSSGDYYVMGIGGSYGSNVVSLFQGFNQGGKFHKLPEVKYTGAPTSGFGNAKILPLVKNKCNNTITPQVGEVNWLMTHEVITADPMYVATSYDGIHWAYLTQLPANCLGQGDFFVDNDDPSDYHNIHVLSFVPSPGYMYETHPTSADFSTWSTPVLIFSTGINQTFDETVILINGVYHMFYSTSYAAHHYLYHATCTYNPWILSNDWSNVQTGNWSGLGDIESISIFNIGGSSWIIYYVEFVGTVLTQKYSISTDNCATWGTGVNINELISPNHQVSTSFVKLK